MLNLHPDKRAKAGDMAIQDWLTDIVVRGDVEVQSAVIAQEKPNEGSSEQGRRKRKKNNKSKSQTKSPAPTASSSTAVESPTHSAANSTRGPNASNSPVAAKSKSPPAPRQDALKPVSPLSNEGEHPSAAKSRSPPARQHTVPVLEAPKGARGSSRPQQAHHSPNPTPVPV